MRREQIMSNGGATPLSYPLGYVGNVSTFLCDTCQMCVLIWAIWSILGFYK